MRYRWPAGTVFAQQVLTVFQKAIKRRTVMRKARSNKKRPVLLAALELRYRNRD